MAMVSMGGAGDKSGDNPIFHDFLGISHGEALPVVLGKSGVADGSRSLKPMEIADPRVSAPASAAGSRERAFVSASSDLGPGTELNNQFPGRKRANSDSGFMGFPRERMAPTASPFPESSSKLKEAQRGPRDEAAFGIHPSPRVASSSLLIHHSLSRPDLGGPKSDAMMQNMMQRDKSYLSSVPLVSQAQDEGSRTGTKNSKLFHVINSAGDKTAGSPRLNEPDPSNTLSRGSLSTCNRQMTIFYAGQAHVFDDVPPNKADVIMALAGSDGGSWSTSFSPKLASKPSVADETVVSNPSFPQDLNRRQWNSQAFRFPTSGDRTSRETRPINAAETEARRDA